jgi:ABC-type Mn2+/Zn2+ transport system ATPase subunit
MSSLVSIENVTVRYGRFTACDRINFEINQNDYLAIVGPNGSGKTTMMKTLLGADPGIRRRNPIFLGFSL